MASPPSIQRYKQQDETQYLVGQQASFNQTNVTDDPQISPISESPVSSGYHTGHKAPYAPIAIEMSKTPPWEHAQAKNRTSFVKALRRTAWLTEILSCILALAALAAIILTLAIHQGKTLPKWPSMISITSTMAFFVTVVAQSQRYTRTGATQGGRRPWMSSSLPLLWCGLDDETTRRYGTLNDVRSMEDRGDRMRVSLGRGFDGGDGEGGRWVLRKGGGVVSK